MRVECSPDRPCPEPNLEHLAVHGQCYSHLGTVNVYAEGAAPRVGTIHVHGTIRVLPTGDVDVEFDTVLPGMDRHRTFELSTPMADVDPELVALISGGSIPAGEPGPDAWTWSPDAGEAELEEWDRLLHPPLAPPP